MTRICRRIDYLSQNTWHYISRVYDYDLRISELGITNYLIFIIIDFYRNIMDEVRVWHARNERVTGADILLIIEHPNNICKSHLIQAKKISKSGKYKGIKRWQDNQQYMNLINYAGNLRAYPYFLLYNSEHNCQLNDPTYGMAICRAEWIRDKRFMQFNLPGNGQTPMIQINNILNDNELFPFHYLFCNVQSNSAYPDPAQMNCNIVNQLLETGRYRQVTGGNYDDGFENIDPFLADIKIPLDKLPRHIISIKHINTNEENKSSIEKE